MVSVRPLAVGETDQCVAIGLAAFNGQSKDQMLERKLGLTPNVSTPLRRSGTFSGAGFLTERCSCHSCPSGHRVAGPQRGAVRGRVPAGTAAREHLPRGGGGCHGGGLRDGNGRRVQRHRAHPQPRSGSIPPQQRHRPAPGAIFFVEFLLLFRLVLV